MIDTDAPQFDPEPIDDPIPGGVLPGRANGDRFDVHGVDDLGAKGETKEEKVKKVDKKVLEDLENATGEEQQKKSAKLPDTIQAPGKAPPKQKERTGGKEIE